ncbi:MAG: hypothetical protein ACHP84_01305 [Caulobacterales bacterium]
MKSWLCLCALSVALAGAAASASQPTVESKFGPFVNDGATPYRIRVKSAGHLDARYVAPQTHCASVIIHFLVDGRQRAVTGAVAPGQDSGFVSLGHLTTGPHRLSVRPEGVRGGCVDNGMSSWGGTVYLRGVLAH